MKTAAYLTLLIILITSCTGQRSYQDKLDEVVGLINQDPDSALVILNTLEEHAGKFPNSTKMRWQLLQLSAQNKCDTVFRSDSIQKILVDYYDRHGNPNERMMAHYLLGRAYSDMGEAPEAMRCYQEAVSCADTTSVDCDWWNLSRICFQLAAEYYESYMPEEMLDVLRHSRIYALNAGDTITSILALAKQSGAYELKERKDSTSIVIWEAVRLFKDNDRDDLASQMLSVLIEDEVEKGNMKEATNIVNYYEGSSGYFDENHEIEHGREIYYYSKGIYYLGLGKADSAEWMFRKLLREGQDVNETHAAYLGLRKKYLLAGPKDSLLKYAMLSESSNDSLYQENYKANVQMLQERYNYSRHVENEQRLALSSERKDKLVMILVFSFLFIAVCAMAYYNNWKRRKEALLRDYRNDLERLRKLKAEMAGLVNNKEMTIVKLERESVMKQGDIDELKGLVFDLTEKLEESSRHASEAILEKDKEIKHLIAKYKPYEKFLVNKTKDEVVRTIQKSEIVHNPTFTA